MSEAAEAGERGTGRPQAVSDTQLIAIVVAGLVAALVTFLMVGNDDDLSTTKPKGGAGAEADIPVAKPVAATADQLTALAGSAGYPIYWQGVAPRRTYETTRLADGRVFIRYLPQGTQVGNGSFDYGFVATYPDSTAFRRVKASAKFKGAIVRNLPGGGIAVANKRGRELVRSTSRRLPVAPVFFAYPDSIVMVEVYEPRGVKQAFREIASGQVAPIR